MYTKIVLRPKIVLSTAICVSSGISPATDFVVSQMLTFENKEWLEPRGASDGPVSDFKEKKKKQHSLFRLNFNFCYSVTENID